MAKIQGKSRISWVQICWGWAALLLVCGSILSFATDGDRLLRIATPLGVIMLFAGLCNVLVYRKKTGRASRRALAFGRRNEHGDALVVLTV